MSNSHFTYKGRTPNPSEENVVYPWVILLLDEQSRNLLSVPIMSFAGDTTAQEKAFLIAEFKERYPNAVDVMVDNSLNVTVRY